METFATLLINAKAVNANELITEVETDKYTITDKTEVGKITKLDLHLNGTEIKDNTYYYVYFSNSNSEDIKSKITSQATGECQIETDYKDFSKFFSVNNDSKINVNDDWYMLNGYNYVYVVKQSYVEEEGNHCLYKSRNYVIIVRNNRPKAGWRTHGGGKRFAEKAVV